jgi:hypothetical protein
MRKMEDESEYETNGEGERWERAEVIWWGLQAELTILAVAGLWQMAVYPTRFHHAFPPASTRYSRLPRSLVDLSQRHE